MRPHGSWTEDELMLDIARLDHLIVEAEKTSDERSRCAASYLRQVLRDRRDTLAVISHRRTH